jgi:hypothetical protein
MKSKLNLQLTKAVNSEFEEGYISGEMGVEN